jgi:transcriptional regulator GlxA family with amidase domain
MKVSGAISLILADFMGELDASAADLQRFGRVLDYINENYKKQIPLTDLANIMSVSTMYFSNLFKSTFNISPKQYILGKRLAEGQRLLLESEMSVKEIAYEVGFENENYFSEYFSAKVGAPPLKFRNRKIKTERESIL